MCVLLLLLLYTLANAHTQTHRHCEQGARFQSSMWRLQKEKMERERKIEIINDDGLESTLTKVPHVDDNSQPASELLSLYTSKLWPRGSSPLLLLLLL